ncbi:MAG: hypothetical protein R3F61_33475 [Myxococcota bacterium]
MRHPVLLALFAAGCGILPFGSKDDDRGVFDDSDADVDTDTDADTDTDVDLDEVSVVFKTSGAYSGNLVEIAGSGPPAAAADTLCQLSAEGGGLTGTFKAWISTANVDAIDRIDNVGPWYLTSGDQVFLNASGLVGSPAVGIEYDERGDVTIDSAWTGTQSGGRWSGVDCDSWSYGNGGGDGTTGSGYNDSWTDSSDRPCSETHPLICFEQ